MLLYDTAVAVDFYYDDDNDDEDTNASVDADAETRDHTRDDDTVVKKEKHQIHYQFHY